MPHSELRNKNILHVEGVRKSYGKTSILGGVDLSISQGALCTLVGPSGCGKSTLFRLILGEEPATKGVVLIEGKPAGIPDKKRGVVYQKYSLFPHLTVWQNVTLGLSLKHSFWMPEKVSKKDKERVERLLERANILSQAHKYPYQLSGGQQQRVAIIQAMVSKPRILLMDEPFSALDATTREEMQMLLLELHEDEGVTILFVTHDLVEAIYLGTRVVALSQYYTHDEGVVGAEYGSKIVFDHEIRKIGSKSPSPEFKYSETAVDLRMSLLRDAFDPGHLQRVQEFVFRSGNSFSMQ